ncbi:hypothetical protein FVEG_15218 [Fusarium verticillioides 7600]|uniref:Uncharacterized protein n=1 Tax=Gibberella moniliformis (strain M3125 / FGSC 7600) TaxID=334819 RepID=W7LNS7_GIBM7|nr:hypothetical protein FVEG_15218 [Fusarium verticillioides 7600]EWG41048.1 hypothetical protein FVEG_15218 [Fusarium verticillioides 7600]RBR22753.1 hypothetical protein FVER53590_28313 [Fusarium verticillioides]
MNCFRRAMGWRRLDLMRVFPRVLDIPGPRHISKKSVEMAAPRLDRLPMELIEMVRSYCPDASFWNRLQLLYLQGFVSLGRPVIERNLSCITRWERGDTLPVEGEPLGDSEYLLISLDPDGICKIQRLPKPKHPRPNHGPLVKLRKNVLANNQDLESVKAYF